MTVEAPDESVQPAPTSTFELYRTLVGVAAISGVLIVIVFQLTLPAIKRNKEEALRKSIYEVIPGAKQVATFKVNSAGTLELLQSEDEKAIKYYAGYNLDGDLLGVAIDASGQGFQDKLRLLFGYSPQRQEIIGLKVLESKETPGLGDKIEKDKKFTVQFKDLDVRLTADGSTLEHEISVVKAGKRINRWEIAAITGATISSKAVGKILNEGSKAHLPVIARHAEEIDGGIKGN